MKKITVLFIIIFHFNANGQNPNLEFKAKYEDAKLSIKSKNFSKALTQFEYLSKSYTQNNHSPYIQYFIGFSKFKLLQLNDAEKTVQELLSNYPEWSQKDDANFLLGSINISKKDLKKALNSFEKVNSKKLWTNINTILKKELFNISDKNLIKQYVNEYPNIEILKEFLSNSKIIDQYGLLPDNVPILPDNSKFQNLNKGFINVGVLFPFQLKNISSEKNENDNQYAIDMYEGMLFGVEKLKDEGITIKLHAYDIENKIDKIEKLLYNKQFLEEDLIIGPLHSETNKIAQYYANEKKVPLLNPLSKNADLITNKLYSFLVNASFEHQAEQAANFVINNFYGDAIVIYGNTAKDSTVAMAYAAEFHKQSNKAIQTIKYLNSNSLNSLVKNKIGHIFMVCSSKLGGTIFNIIEKKMENVPVIAMRESFPDLLQFNSNNKPNLYFINPEFVDDNNENIKNFKLDFWNKRNILASYYTIKGYDMMLFWGRQISKNKSNFKQMLSIKANNDGYLLNGFDYSNNSNENSALTITAFENGNEVIFRKK